MRNIVLSCALALGLPLWGTAALASPPDLSSVAWPGAQVDAHRLAPSRLTGVLAERAGVVRSFLSGVLAVLPGDPGGEAVAPLSGTAAPVSGTAVELRSGQLAAWARVLLLHGVVASPAEAAQVAAAVCPAAFGAPGSDPVEVRAACWVDLVVWAQDALVEGAGTAERAQKAPGQRKDWTDQEKAERKHLALAHEGRALRDAVQALQHPADFAVAAQTWVDRLGPGVWPMYRFLQAELVRYARLATLPMPLIDEHFPTVAESAAGNPQAMALALRRFKPAHRKALRDRLCFQGYCPTPPTLDLLSRVRKWSLPGDVATTALAAKTWKEIHDPSLAFDPALLLAVENFQSDHGLRVTGLVDASTRTALRVPMSDRVEQLRLSLQRIRDTAMPAADVFLIVNLPAFRLDVWRGGVVERSHAVQVGIAFETKHGKRTPRRQSPLLTATLGSITVNPAWFVPGSILAEVYDEFRRDSKYRKRNGFEYRSIAASDRKVLVMAAGPQNALGEVKFEFPNPHLVFMHDTPSRWRFVLPERMTSHGCVRVHDAAVLARSLLTHDEGVEWTAAKWKQLRKDKNEYRIVLHKPLPIHLMYLSADAAPDGHARFFRDFYELDVQDRRLVSEWRARQMPPTVPGVARL